MWVEIRDCASRGMRWKHAKTPPGRSTLLRWQTWSARNARKKNLNIFNSSLLRLAEQWVVIVAVIMSIRFSGDTLRIDGWLRSERVITFRLALGQYWFGSEDVACFWFGIPSRHRSRRWGRSGKEKAESEYRSQPMRSQEVINGIEDNEVWHCSSLFRARLVRGGLVCFRVSSLWKEEVVRTCRAYSEFHYPYLLTSAKPLPVFLTCSHSSLHLPINICSHDQERVRMTLRYPLHTTLEFVRARAATEPGATCIRFVSEMRTTKAERLDISSSTCFST